MTKKHFIEAAKIIRDIKPKRTRAWTATKFATLFRKCNDRFDKKKFFEACNVK